MNVASTLQSRLPERNIQICGAQQAITLAANEATNEATHDAGGSHPSCMAMHEGVNGGRVCAWGFFRPPWPRAAPQAPPKPNWAFTTTWGHWLVFWGACPMQPWHEALRAWGGPSVPPRPPLPPTRPALGPLWPTLGLGPAGLGQWPICAATGKAQAPRVLPRCLVGWAFFHGFGATAGLWPL